ncbi:hypothetical protein LSAT2_007098, partial [Lamellibrachia satsuma]
VLQTGVDGVYRATDRGWMESTVLQTEGGWSLQCYRQGVDGVYSATDRGGWSLQCYRQGEDGVYSATDRERMESTLLQTEGGWSL